MTNLDDHSSPVLYAILYIFLLGNVVSNKVIIRMIPKLNSSLHFDL